MKVICSKSISGRFEPTTQSLAVRILNGNPRPILAGERERERERQTKKKKKGMREIVPGAKAMMQRERDMRTRKTPLNKTATV